MCSPCQLGAQHLWRVHLDNDLTLEIPAGIKAKVGMRGPSEAVKARMTASPVRVDRPTERHARLLGHAVEDRSGADLVEAGPEGPGSIKPAHHRLVAVARQPPLPFAVDRKVIPAHERMFAYHPHGSALGSGAGFSTPGHRQALAYRDPLREDPYPLLRGALAAQHWESRRPSP